MEVDFQDREKNYLLFRQTLFIIVLAKSVVVNTTICTDVSNNTLLFVTSGGNSAIKSQNILRESTDVPFFKLGIGLPEEGFIKINSFLSRSSFTESSEENSLHMQNTTRTTADNTECRQIKNTEVFSNASRKQDRDINGDNSLNSIELGEWEIYTSTDFDTTKSYNTNVQKSELFKIFVEDCINKGLYNIIGRNGTIFIIQNVNSSKQICIWRIQVPKGYFIKAKFETISCKVSVVYISDFPKFDDDNYFQCDLNGPVYSLSSVLYFHLVTSYLPSSTSPVIKLHFESSQESYRSKLVVGFTSNSTGFIASSENDQTPYAKGMNATYRLDVPKGHVVMVSFPVLEIGSTFFMSCNDPDYGSILEIENNKEHKLRRVCDIESSPAQFYNSSLIIHFYSDLGLVNIGFRLLFSFHVDSEILHTSGTGQFNCNVPYYSAFKRHLECNLEQECLGGEDEQYCPFGNPGCNGSAGYENKCYSYVHWNKTLTWQEADSYCNQTGQRLASMTTPGQWDAFLKLLKFMKRQWPVYVGARTVPAHKGSMYSSMFQWSDKTIAYFINITFDTLGSWDTLTCTIFHPIESNLYAHICERFPIEHFTHVFVCERDIEFNQTSKHEIEIKFASSVFNFSKMSGVSSFQCSDGTVISYFGICDPMSHCGYIHSHNMCITPGGGVLLMFVCENQKTVHYSLVCDFRRDCSDGSDEHFCYHSTCDEHMCRNAQCVTLDLWCDGISHCFDGSDTELCDGQLFNDEVLTLHPPAIIDFDGHGNFINRTMQNTSSCPYTHFACKDGYCLPVYVRCNGVYDCPHHEDEMECQKYTCPGFYRCRGSIVCIHSDHICDGWPQCPLQDDEWMCGHNLSCPEGCHCQGLAFVCPKSFPAHEYSDLRYVDASNSGMTPLDFSANLYLIYLNLSNCHLKTITGMHYTNLQKIDLSYNELEAIDMDTFVRLVNLQVLILSGNPLVTIHPALTDTVQEKLTALHLSRTEIKVFSSEPLKRFTKLEKLYLSNTLLSTIDESGFRHLLNLEILDLSGSSVEEFPGDLFKNLQNLFLIKADNYKLCCRATLPDSVDLKNCIAPRDEVSSCEDLLRSDSYRVCLWALASLVVVENAGSILFRLIFHNKMYKSGFQVFVLHLSFADILIGVYLIIIGVADVVYRGNYLWYEKTWKHSMACKTAGFLSLLSSEVSAFIIFLITLDRFLVLRFPFSRLHFRRFSAAIACGVAWLVGVVIASVPFMTSQWMFYGQTGICRPLPITKQSFQGHAYSFRVQIILNFVLILMIALGQIAIFWTVRANAMTTGVNRKSKDSVIARHLSSVAMSNFLCWFPIGVLGIMSSRGTPIPGDVNVGIAIFVLPLNSALNPFLFSFNFMMEKRRKAKEQWRIKKLEASILSTETFPDKDGNDHLILVHSAQKYLGKETDKNALRLWRNV